VWKGCGTSGMYAYMYAQIEDMACGPNRILLGMVAHSSLHVLSYCCFSASNIINRTSPSIRVLLAPKIKKIACAMMAAMMAAIRHALSSLGIASAARWRHILIQNINHEGPAGALRRGTPSLLQPVPARSSQRRRRRNHAAAVAQPA